MIDDEPSTGDGTDNKVDRLTKSAWQRFLDQKTMPQRFLIALAGTVAALVTIGGGIYAVGQWVGGGSTGGRQNETPEVSGERVEQGTPAADQLVRQLLEAAGGRLMMDQIVSMPSGYQPGNPEGVIYGHVPLLYNCKGKPLGDDNCNRVRLEFANEPPPTTVEGSAVHFRGTYSIRVRNGTIFGTNLDIVLDDIAK